MSVASIQDQGMGIAPFACAQPRFTNQLKQRSYSQIPNVVIWIIYINKNSFGSLYSIPMFIDRYVCKSYFCKLLLKTLYSPAFVFSQGYQHLRTNFLYGLSGVIIIFEITSEYIHQQQPHMQGSNLLLMKFLNER